MRLVIILPFFSVTQALSFKKSEGSVCIPNLKIVSVQHIHLIKQAWGSKVSYHAYKASRRMYHLKNIVA
jgi:hypothetical protein